MKYRFAFDLGTNSIGWCVLQLTDNLEVCGLENMGVRIFSDGRDSNHEPLAVARRTARGIRRNIARRRQRRRKLFRLLQKNGLYPLTREEAQALKSEDPYTMRVRALDEKLEPYQLGRALFHLGVRRGFKSNRKDNPDESAAQAREATAAKTAQDKMKQGQKCQHLEQTLIETNSRTLGEFLFKQRQQGHKIRFTADETVYYPLRSMYEAEFEAIRRTQQQYYPAVDWDAIHHAIFFQRPLRAQERGRCQFMTDKPRTFKAMPSAQKYRILQEVYNLAGYDEMNHKVILSNEQQDLIINELDQKKELSFNSIRKLLHEQNMRFNLETQARDRLNGNTTACTMRKPAYFGSHWDKMTLREQDRIVELLITANEDSEIQPELERYPLTDEQKKAILRIVFPSGTTSLCKELTQQLVSLMKETRVQFDQALEKLGYHHYDNSVEQYDILPYYGKVLTGSTTGADPSADEKQPERKYGRISNPTVHIALNQTRTIVNALIRKYGKPEQIVLELSRDLKASREQKEAIETKQAANAKRNKTLNQKIIEHNPHIQFPGRMERLKYRLWEELGTDSLSRRCLYCGQTISGTDLFTSDIEIEHILPFSRTLLNAESNLTLAHRRCNAYKAERSPFEAFGSSPAGYNWADIMERVRSLSNKTKQGRFAENAMDSFVKENAFIDRQLTDNQYIARIALRYLQAVCNNVWPVNGAMTKLLRDRWEIDPILHRRIEEKDIVTYGLKNDAVSEYRKNRYDHRHHALDAMVIGLCDRSLVQALARANSHRTKEKLEVPLFPFIREDVIDRVKQIVPSFKPDHGMQGKLSKETLLACIRQENTVDIKELKPEDIPLIKTDRVRKEIQSLYEQTGDIKKVRKRLADIYPQVKIFRRIYASRTPLRSFKSEADISTIIDIPLRNQLRAFIASHPDEKFEKALHTFTETTGIKRVRCATFVQTPIIIEPDPANPLAATRYLNPEDYLAVIIWEIPPQKAGKPPKYEGQFLRRTNVNAKGELLLKKPHAAAKQICRLYKNDYIEFSQDGIWKKACVAGYSATQNKLDIRPVCAANDTASWVIATTAHMQEPGWKPQSGHYYVSINKMFGELAARKITVSPIGQVFRKS